MSFQGKNHSQETKLKMSFAQRGKKFTEEHRKNISLARKKIVGWKHSLATIEKMKLTNGRYWIGKKRKYYPRKPLTEEHKAKLSESHRGEKSHLWKGGVTPINLKIRMSRRYKIWRKTVFEKDNYSCQICGMGGNKVYLQADHIKQFSLYPSLRLDINNGRTLCVECHKKTPTWGINTPVEKEVMPYGATI